ncbi:hypothetical protein WL886_11850 [Escherichia coli]|uniref:hypothetical protein n=1 Tax=Escherichia coli TaxID=562 RepID=UPI0008109D42|nr:hypothetical protein [Escherichia coli]ANW29528.1 hypothetical protein BB405_11720 [Escherichia coli]MCZ5978541.1 hypothetical protein [Escherichia coli]HBV0521126.1 hypothetical protein [Escherichia coli]HCO5917198.1 hypothetical protein [Escherichia coli]HCO5951003.1 hypothetical protein [Escherichia coli]
MDKIPFDVLIHSENALNRALEMKAVLIKLTEVHAEQGDLFSAFSTLLTPVIDELNAVMEIHDKTRAEE